MTLALLADAYGRLSDLDCSTCSEEQREQRGCGRPPMVPDGEGGDRVWTWRLFRRECEQRHLLPDDAAASRFYSLAGRGHPVALTGTPWGMCPRSYLRRDLPSYSASAHRAAQRALRTHATPERLPLEAVVRLPLVPGQVDLLRLIERAHASYQADRQREHMDALRERHQSGGG